jgi:hypothetical protein
MTAGEVRHEQNPEEIMDRFSLLSLIAASSALVCCGCGGGSEIIYMDHLAVHGPIAQPPLHLTQKVDVGEFHFTPSITTIPTPSLQAHLTDGFSNSSATTKNFEWTVPAKRFGFDADWSVGPKSILSFGAHYSFDAAGTWGGIFSYGIPFVGEQSSARLEFGAIINTVRYDASCRVIRQENYLFGGTQTTTELFHDVGESTPVSVYGSLTVNGHAGSVVNLFGSLALVRQSVLSYSPRGTGTNGTTLGYTVTDTRATQTYTFLFLTPGVAVRLSPAVQILLGTRIAVAMGMGDEAVGMAMPLLQFDVRL